MFDYICCELPMPDGRQVSKDSFQTKSLWRSMDRFTITTAGRLVYHKHRYSDPSAGLPQSLVHVGDIDLDYHGDLAIHGSRLEDGAVSYVVRFTHGTAESIRRLEELSEIHLTWLLDRGL